ncbi:MAG: thrombospondin type 3 repeat-containing protein [archaeon]
MGWKLIHLVIVLSVLFLFTGCTSSGIKQGNGLNFDDAPVENDSESAVHDLTPIVVGGSLPIHCTKDTDCDTYCVGNKHLYKQVCKNNGCWRDGADENILELCENTDEVDMVCMDEPAPAQCRRVDFDADDDGVPEIIDTCPGLYSPEIAPVPGLTEAERVQLGIMTEIDLQVDSDEDGIGDICDNCPLAKNPFELDTDGNGVPDAQLDRDEDGIGDVCDICPNEEPPGTPTEWSQYETTIKLFKGYTDIEGAYGDFMFDGQLDADEDSIGDQCDLCPDGKTFEDDRKEDPCEIDWGFKCPVNRVCITHREQFTTRTVWDDASNQHIQVLDSATEFNSFNVGPTSTAVAFTTTGYSYDEAGVERTNTGVIRKGNKCYYGTYVKTVYVEEDRWEIYSSGVACDAVSPGFVCKEELIPNEIIDDIVHTSYLAGYCGKPDN